MENFLDELNTLSIQFNDNPRHYPRPAFGVGG